MARSLRVEYPGAYYHVMARGNRREFLDEDDRGFGELRSVDASFAKGSHKGAAILVVLHNGLSPVPSRHHMIHRPGEFYPHLPRHDQFL